MTKRLKALIDEVKRDGGFGVIVDNNRSLLEKQNVIRSLVGRKPLKRLNLDGFDFDEQELHDALPDGFFLVWNDSGDLLVMDEENYEKYEEI